MTRGFSTSEGQLDEYLEIKFNFCLYKLGTQDIESSTFHQKTWMSYYCLCLFFIQVEN
jgi:hypothetical protein